MHLSSAHQQDKQMHKASKDTIREPPKNPIGKNKLPSGNFSVVNNGEELSLRPSSPHRYTFSATSKKSNAGAGTKHSRCSTVSSGNFKFIPATELVSFEESQVKEISDELVSNPAFEDEPRLSIVYPSDQHNRNSLVSSTNDQIVISTTSSPQDQRLDTLYTISRNTSQKLSLENPDCCYTAKGGYNSFVLERKSHDSDEQVTLKKDWMTSSARIYCENCRENVEIHVKLVNQQKNLIQRICCSVICDAPVSFIERVLICRSCNKEITRIKVKKECNT